MVLTTNGTKNSAHINQVPRLDRMKCIKENLMILSQTQIPHLRKNSNNNTERKHRYTFTPIHNINNFSFDLKLIRRTVMLEGGKAIFVVRRCRLCITS